MRPHDLVEIDGIDEVARRHDDIRLRVRLDVLHVEHEVRHVVIVDLRCEVLLAVQDAQTAALRVDVVVQAGAQMLDQAARLLLAVDLDLGDAGIGHIRENEVDDAVAPHEADGRDRTVIVQAADGSCAVFKIDDSQCVAHSHLVLLLLTPRTSWRRARYARCPCCRALRPARLQRHPPRCSGSPSRLRRSCSPA